MGRSVDEPMKPAGDWPGRRAVETAEGWLSLGDWQEAEAQLDGIPAEFREHPEVWKAYADVHEIAQNWEAAIAATEGLIRSEPEEIDHWLRLTAAQLSAGQAEAAQKRLQAFLKRRPDHPALLFKLAVTLGALGKFSDAGANLTRLLTMEHSRYAKAYIPLALDCVELRAFHDQLRDMQEYLG